MSDDDLRHLAVRLARGDESAFAELYDACADSLYAFVAARLGDREAASDVVQAAFLRAVKSRKRFRQVENPAAYLFQIARNEISRALAKRGRVVSGSLSPADLYLPAKESSPSVDDAEAAAVALARLDADTREVVELKLYAGLTFREIAEVTGRPQGSVATRYRRALASLREWLTRATR